MANEEIKEGETAPKKSGNMLMIILIVLLVALIGVVGFFAYMFMNQAQPQTAEQKTAEESKKANEEVTKETFIAKIENLVLNITNAKGREKLMKLSFSLKSSEPTVATLVESNNAEIIDTVIAQISARTSEELLTVGGKSLLKEEMLQEINNILNDATVENSDTKKNMVKKLFFTSFVIK
jgi:flagellar FliL protein